MTLLKFGTRLMLYALPDNVLSCLKVLCHAALYNIQCPHHFPVLLSIYTCFYKILYIICAIFAMSPIYCIYMYLFIALAIPTSNFKFHYLSTFCCHSYPNLLISFLQIKGCYWSLCRGYFLRFFCRSCVAIEINGA